MVPKSPPIYTGELTNCNKFINPNNDYSTIPEPERSHVFIYVHEMLLMTGLHKFLIDQFIWKEVFIQNVSIECCCPYTLLNGIFKYYAHCTQYIELTID